MLIKTQQDLLKRTGQNPRSLGQIIAGRRPEAEVYNLQARQLRRRGTYGQAALLIDQAALQEKDPARQEKARVASAVIKELSAPKQLEFDFFRGNFMTADQFHDTIRDRLKGLPLTSAQRAQAFYVLSEIIRWLPWQDFVCSKSAEELSEILGIKKTHLSTTLRILENVGAIRRIRRGRSKVITVTPEGAYRGQIDRHPEIMAQYKAEVISLHGDKR